MAYLAYRLKPLERIHAAAHIDPRFPLIKADHITHALNVPDRTRNAAIPKPDKVEILGAVVDPGGMQVAVVRVNGERKRPDGEWYHCTWSYDPNAAPSEALKPFMDEEGRAEPGYRSQHAKAVMKATFNEDGTVREGSGMEYIRLLRPISIKPVAMLVRDDGSSVKVGGQAASR